VLKTTANDTPVISGTADLKDGEKLNVVIRGLSGRDLQNATPAEGRYSNVRVDTNGNWHIDKSTSGTGNITYINGEQYEVEASIIDKAGNISKDITTNEILYDTSKMATTTIDNIITKNSTPKITGTAVLQDGETLEVEVDGKVYKKVDGLSYTTDQTKWSLEIPESNRLSNGVYNVRATIKNANTGKAISDTTTNELKIDKIAPEKPNVSLKNDTTNGKSGYDNDNITNDATINLPTNIEDGAKVEYQINDESWKDEYIAPQIAQGEEKKYRLYIKQTDKAGNSSTQLLSFTLDNKAPDIPDIKLIADTGIHGDNITNSARLTNPTNLEDGAKIEYKVDNGEWKTTYDMPSTTGDYKVLVRQIDKAGNISAEKTIDINLLSNVPTPNAKLTNDTTDGKDGHDSDFITSDPNITAPNNITDGQIEYKLNNGNWEQSYTPPTADGDYTVLIRQTDKAGNMSDTQELNFTLDNTKPSALSLSLATNQTTVNIEGLGQNHTWQYSTDGGANWQDGVNSSFEIDRNLSEYGATDIQAKQINKIGTQSDITSDILVVLDLEGRDVEYLEGSNSSDLINGNEFDNKLFGLGGDDIIKAFNGNDVIGGGSGNDTLYGGDGIDTIDGGSGDDIIVGGRDLNILTGGDGSDTFVYGSDYGSDTITDFAPNVDKLDFKSLFLNATNDNLTDYIKVEATGDGDTKILIDKDGLQNGSSYTDLSIVLKNVDATYQNLSDNNVFVID
jgi:Ca2+-binding RTX toxin-like protein